MAWTRSAQADEAAQAALAKLLSPQSCLVVGPSRDPATYTGRPLRFLEEWGFAGNIGVVHPGAAEVDAWARWHRYRSIEEAASGSPWDVALVLLPGPQASDALIRCAEIGIRSAVVIASPVGFDRQAIQQSGIRFLGPNTFGCFTTWSRTPLTFATLLLREQVRSGTTAFFSQAGGVANTIIDVLRCGGGIATWICTGNEWSLDIVDCVDMARDEPRIREVGLYLEGLPRRDIRQAITRLTSVGKRCGVVLGGISDLGRRAAVSHTGKIAAITEATRDLLQSSGAMVFDLPHQMSFWLASPTRQPRRDRVAVVTPSGGFGVLLADVLSKVADVPEPSLALSYDLGRMLPGWDRQLIVDTGLLATNRVHSEAEVVLRLLDDHAIDSVLWVIAVDIHSNRDLAEVTQLFKQRDDVRGRLILCNLVYSYEPAEPAASNWRELGVPWVRSLADVEAMLQPARLHTPAVSTGHPSVAVTRRQQPDSTPRLVQDLVAAGIAFVETRWARTCEEAVAAANQIGWPVALKAAPDRLSHKTEVGAVALGIRDADDMSTQWKHLADRYDVTAGCWIQKMARGRHEFIVGFSRQDAINGTILVGPGGELAELLADVAYLGCEATKPSVIAKLRGLKVGPVFDGYRGKPPLAIELLAETVVAVARLVSTDPSIEEFELNPVVVGENSCVAVDVLISRSTVTSAPELGAGAL